jgi:Carboxypeptidase regulatory-like domain/TonB dependent receptor
VRMNRGVWPLVCLFLAASLSIAQSPNGTISGIVLDPSGGVIVGADVLIINNATGVEYPGKANSEGYYVVPNIPPGNYRIQVSNSGFKTIIKPDIMVHVEDALAINFTLPIGAASEIVTVEGGAPLINTENGSVSTVIDRNFVESLPLNGRSFNTLLQLTPGVVIASQQTALGNAPGQFSISGQRTDANNLTVDGVSANFGISPVGPDVGVGQSGTGTAQAFSVLGGTSSLVSVDALQEFRIETSSFAPEFGRSPGGQIILTTRSGTNQFHGVAFEYFRNTVMDANDWFLNQQGLPRTAEQHNDFGGVLGGPIVKDKAFFFFSYEGARLLVPQEYPLTVPSEFALNQAQQNAPALFPLLNAYPKAPSSAVLSPDGYSATFTGGNSNRDRLNATSLRFDYAFSERFSLFGRYNYAPSSSATLFGSELTLTSVNTQTATAGLDMALSPRLGNTLRVNYSEQDSPSTYELTTSGGAVPVSPSLLLGSLSAAESNAAFQPGANVNPYELGRYEGNRTKQVNVVDGLSVSLAGHQVKVGGDYRAIFLDVNPSAYNLEYYSTSVSDLIASETAFLSAAAYLPSRILTQAFSLYGQDSWRVNPRLMLTYGVRWELSPAPSGRGATELASWTNIDNPADIALAPPGAHLWSTTFGNFAPRVGVAYQLTPKGDFVLRAGWGLFYDLGVGSSASLASEFPNEAFGPTSSVAPPVSDVTPFLPTFSSAPPYPTYVMGFAPNLKLPRSYQGNLALEKSFGTQSVFSATYVVQAGRDLLRREGLALPQSNPNFLPGSDFILTANDARSNYNALQLQYRGKPVSRVQILLNFTWAHSLDDASDDVTAGLSNTIISAANDYSSSSFDVRRMFSGAVDLAIPALAKSGPLNAITEGWSADAIIVARTGFPFNAVNLVYAPLNAGGQVLLRPDLVPGLPYWVPDPAAPEGRILNANKFVIPTTVRQGTEGRNDISGFGMAQMDFSLARKFPIKERLNLQFRADAFNLLNHPNFANPYAYLGFGPAYLQASTMLNQGLGGLNPLFQQGGPRSLQLSLKLSF